MAAPFPDRLARVGYRRARQLLVVTGLAVLGVVVAVLLVRRVDTVEVLATVLFVPILLALLFFRLPGGIVAALAASAAYAALRWPAIEAVGGAEFTGLLVSRTAAYLLFGTVGGWASATLESSLDKLELFDQVDDATALGNARALLSAVDLERARSQRYRTVFSVATAEFPAAALPPGRRRRAVLRELGRQLADGVRTVDRVSHGSDGRVHALAVVLPETAAGGAAVFHGRFVAGIGAFLAERGPGGDVGGAVHTIPGDEAALDAVLAAWRRFDAADHPS